MSRVSEAEVLQNHLDSAIMQLDTISSVAYPVVSERDGQYLLTASNHTELAGAWDDVLFAGHNLSQLDSYQTASEDELAWQIPAQRSASELRKRRKIGSDLSKLHVFSEAMLPECRLDIHLIWRRIVDSDGQRVLSPFGPAYAHKAAQGQIKLAAEKSAN